MQNTRYVGLEFGIHGYMPYRVPLIVQRGFGDCKDKASLLYTMLREAGIDARIVLVRTRHNGNISQQPASLAVFDHAIAYVPELDMFLDGTAEHSGVDELPVQDQGVNVLVVSPKTAELRQTPVLDADKNSKRQRTLQVSLSPDGGAEVKGDETVAGADAASYRDYYQAPGTRAERFERSLGSLYPGLKLEDQRFDGLDKLQQPVKYTLPHQGAAARALERRRAAAAAERAARPGAGHGAPATAPPSARPLRQPRLRRGPQRQGPRRHARHAICPRAAKPPRRSGGSSSTSPRAARRSPRTPSCASTRIASLRASTRRSGAGSKPPTNCSNNASACARTPNNNEERDSAHARPAGRALCGCAAHLSEAPTSISALRAEAAASPRDAKAQQRVALAEIFADEGDPQEHRARARPRVRAHAERRAPAVRGRHRRRRRTATRRKRWTTTCARSCSRRAPRIPSRRTSPSSPCTRSAASRAASPAGATRSASRSSSCSPPRRCRCPRATTPACC